MRIGVTFNVRQSPRREGSASQALARLMQPELPSPPLDDPARDARSDDEDEEFDSPETIMALHSVLQELGHEVLLLGDGPDLIRRLLRGPRPELVLNIAEGHGASRSREARVPAVLEMLGIPHTGSDPLTLAVTLDKDCAKRLVQAGGVSTPAWVLVPGNLDDEGYGDIEEQVAGLALPVIVKPAYEGSSKGIMASSLIFDRAELLEAIARLQRTYHQPILVEEFIDGDELTVGIVGNAPPEVLGIMRVLPIGETTAPFVYSLEVKRDWERLVRYECPARLSPADSAAVREAALACWRALGCRDVARIDFRLRDHEPYFLEANPLPGLSPVSGDLVLLCRRQGIDYADLIGRILAAAVKRIERPAHDRARSGAVAR